MAHQDQRPLKTRFQRLHTVRDRFPPARETRAQLCPDQGLLLGQRPRLPYSSGEHQGHRSEPAAYEEPVSCPES